MNRNSCPSNACGCLSQHLKNGARADAVAWQVKTTCLVNNTALGFFQAPWCFYEIVNDHRLLEAYLLAHAISHSRDFHPAPFHYGPIESILHF